MVWHNRHLFLVDVTTPSLSAAFHLVIQGPGSSPTCICCLPSGLGVFCIQPADGGEGEKRHLLPHSSAWKQHAAALLTFHWHLLATWPKPTYQSWENGTGGWGAISRLQGNTTEMDASIIWDLRAVCAAVTESGFEPRQHGLGVYTLNHHTSL